MTIYIRPRTPGANSSFGPGTMPTNAVAETVSRKLLNSTSLTLTSGVMRGSLVHLEVGQIVTSLTWQGGGTAMSGGSHLWMAVLDTTGKCLAVSADDTAPTWAGSVEKSQNMTSPYTVPTTGGYYFVHCAVATTMNSYAGFGASTVGVSTPLAGISASGKTTPPAVGATVSGIAANSSIDYGYAL